MTLLARARAKNDHLLPIATEHEIPAELSRELVIAVYITANTLIGGAIFFQGHPYM